MSLSSLILTGQLDAGFILAPERYDPRRSSGIDGVPLGTIAELKGKAVSTAKMDPAKRYLVLDAGDAAEGYLRPRSEPVEASEVKSAKKPIRPGDVIVSRLRPYLRQVAFVDSALVEDADGAEIVVSTEFYVLRPKAEGESIAFLAPFLLSVPVQQVLSASQEGGHHPRFNKQTLLSLPIPQEVVDSRIEASVAVTDAIESIRSAWSTIVKMSESIS